MSSKSLAVVGLAMLICASSQALAQTPSLGKAASFAVLGTSVSNSGDTLVTGDLGFNDSNGVPREMIHLGVAQPRNSSLVRQAQRDAAAAYAALGRGPCTDPPSFLSPPSPPQPFGISASSVKIYCVHGDLMTLRDTALRIADGGHDWNVFWKVDGDVKLAPRTVFVGTIIAQGNITLDQGASLSGRALSLGGNVALDAASVSLCCPLINVSSTLPLTAGEGTPPYRFEDLSETLPAGVTLTREGTISGTPLPGYYQFIAVATDAHRCAGVQTESVSACPLILSPPPPLPPGCVGQPYHATISANGSGFYTWEATEVPGLVFTGGVWSGSPTTPGIYTPTVNVTDNITHCTSSQQFPITIGIEITPEALPDATVGENYHFQFPRPLYAAGMVKFDKISGPGWPLIDSNGNVYGMPNAEGTVCVTVRVTDTQGCSADKTYCITVNAPCPALTISPETLPDGTVGEQYGQPIQVTGGCAPYTFAVDPATLPPGLNGFVGNVLSGTPTLPGCFTFRVVVTDCRKCSSFRDYTVGICGKLELPPTLPTATFGVPYRYTLNVTGGKPPYLFSITGGSLPTWLSLSETGVLYGTPGVDVHDEAVAPNMIISPGTPFTVTAIGCCCSATVSHTYNAPVRVCPYTITIDTALLPNGRLNEPYPPGATLNAHGATAPLDFNVVTGSLPPGLTLTPGPTPTSTTLKGTPNTPGTYCFGIVAAEQTTGCASEPQDYMVTITGPTCPAGTAITLAPSSLAQPVVGTPYRQQLTAAGGTLPYKFYVSTGALPCGLTLDSSTGVISGIPTMPGLVEFTLTAVDANGCVSMGCQTTVQVVHN